MADFRTTQQFLSLYFVNLGTNTSFRMAKLASLRVLLFVCSLAAALAGVAAHGSSGSRTLTGECHMHYQTHTNA
jgi:hypothetical protein